MNINSLKNKFNTENTYIPELLMTAFLGILMLVQRFLTGGYKPVMDDWFLYGDLYGTADRITQFAIPNEKFAIRPFTGIVDCFLTAPLFSHLWIVQLLVTLSLLSGAFLIIHTLRKNNAAGAGFFMCLVCLFPVGFEATYWLAAATRISYSILFIGAAVFALDSYYKTNRRRSLILYGVLGLISVGFYEPAIVIYVILTMFVIWNNYKDKKSLIPVIIFAAQICLIGLYYVVNSGAGEIESRGGIVEGSFTEHTMVVWGYIRDIFVSKSTELMKNGFEKGLDVILGGHKIMKLTIISAASLGFGVFSAICIKKRKLSFKIFLLGIALFFGGIILIFILGSDRIPLRLVYFSYLGAGLMIDELLTLLPRALNRTVSALALTCLAFIFTIAGVGEVRDYQQTSDFDVYITQQLIDLDTPERITDVNKNTYLFGGQHSYEETRCIHYLDHIRGASGNYADITGCMRHLTNVPFTNSIATFTYGDIQIMKPYIDQEGVCSFYNIEYDKTVVRADIVPDGENYNVVREDGSIVGTLVKVDDVRYQFFN